MGKASITFAESALLDLEDILTWYEHEQVPEVGRRLVQEARGYGATVKRGVVVREDDEATGERPGQLLRGAQPAPT